MRQDRSLDEDVASPRFLADPYPTYDRLRREDPVHWCEPWNCWVLTRYADIRDVLRMDGHAFGVTGRVWKMLSGVPDSSRAALKPVEEHFSSGVLHRDPPEHGRIRGLISQFFTPRAIEERRWRVQAIVDELLDGLAHRARVDLVADFAFPLPAMVVGELVGFPAEDRDQNQRWLDGINASFNSNHPSLDALRGGLESLQAIRSYLAGLAVQSAHEPRADVITRLAEARRGEGPHLTEGDLLSTCFTLFVGGHETTTALIASAVLALRRHPQQMQLLRSRPSLLRSAIEEFLRIESPNQRITRIAREDVSINGRDIKRGDIVMLLLGSANRDPEEFPSPDRLDIGRTPNRHLAFALGPHVCIGAPLARLEAELAVGGLLRRFPDLRLETLEPQWLGNPTLRMLKALPATVA